MLYSVRGTLIHMEPRIAVVECGGVGFRCYITMNTARQLPKVGEEASLYTMMSVREDAIELFGFADQGELECFKQLTSISGVGPKAAVAVLSELSPERWRWRRRRGITRRSLVHRESGQSLRSASFLNSRTRSASCRLPPASVRRKRDRCPPLAMPRRRWTRWRCSALRRAKQARRSAGWTAVCRWKRWCVRRSRRWRKKGKEGDRRVCRRCPRGAGGRKIHGGCAAGEMGRLQNNCP